MDLPRITLGNRQIQPTTIDEPDAEMAKRLLALLSNAEQLDQQCRAAMLTEAAATQYANHHFAEVPALAAKFGVADPGHPSPAQVQALLAEMYVASIWSSPNAYDTFLHFDYTIDAAATQYLLSVTINREGQLSTMTMES